MSLGAAAGVVVVLLLMAEAANLARTWQARLQQPRQQPSLQQALAFLTFAVLFAALMWAEHLWVLRRGDYAGVGLRHTWYWTVTTWAGLAVCLGRLLWLARALSR